MEAPHRSNPLGWVLLGTISFSWGLPCPPLWHCHCLCSFSIVIDKHESENSAPCLIWEYVFRMLPASRFAEVSSVGFPHGFLTAWPLPGPANCTVPHFRTVFRVQTSSSKLIACRVCLGIGIHNRSCLTYLSSTLQIEIGPGKHVTLSTWLRRITFFLMGKSIQWRLVS